MKFLVIGGSSWDTLIHVDKFPEAHPDQSIWASRTIETVGGTGAGKAIALDALGADVTLVTAFSNDVKGDHIVNFYKNYTNIRVYNLLVDQTETHTNIMHNEGDRLSIFTTAFSKNPEYQDTVRSLIEEADVVLLNINDYCRMYIEDIKIYNKKCLVDIHDYEPYNPYHQDFIDAADILIGSSVNIDNKDLFMREMAEGRDFVVLTSGKEGLEALGNDGELYKVPGYNDFDYIDSNGAGDSFCAGFIYEYMKSEDYGKSLEIGNITGGLACSSDHLFRLDITYKDIIEIYKKRS